MISWAPGMLSEEERVWEAEGFPGPGLGRAAVSSQAR